MKKSRSARFVRSLIASLLALGLLCGLCTNAAFASTAPADAQESTSTSQPNNAPPPVDLPVTDLPTTGGGETDVPPDPPEVSQTTGLVPSQYMLGKPEIVYDRDLHRLFVEFSLSDAGALELLIQKCEPVLQLREALASLQKHITIEHNPTCKDHTTEYVLQAVLQQVECERTQGADFSYVGTNGLIRRAEYLLGSDDYKALLAVLEPLVAGECDAESLMERFSDEELAQYRADLVKAAERFFPAYVECVESLKFYYALPVLEKGTGIGIDIPPEPTPEPVCDQAR